MKRIEERNMTHRNEFEASGSSPTTRDICVSGFPPCTPPVVLQPKAWQRIIREAQAALDPRPVASLEDAIVTEIPYEEAKKIILKYEWLGNMGTTERAFGLYIGQELAGVVCFGRTAGNNTAKSIAGKKWAEHVVTLSRGACVHWAPPHAASFLISAACRQMTKLAGWKTKLGNQRKPSYIVVAYSDPEAGEIGTVYQACNWLYCGKGSAIEQFKDPIDGKWKDVRLIHAKTRDRKGLHAPDKKGRAYFEFDGKKYFVGDIVPDGRKVLGSVGSPRLQSRTRTQVLKKLRAAGAEFRTTNPKHRYIGIFADRRTRRQILRDMKWAPFPYPKRGIQSA
jgi:hypothetical protein